MKKLFIAAAALVLLLGAWYQWQIRPVDSGDTKRISVTIPAHTSTSAIGNILNAKGLIRSEWAFFLYTRLHGSQGKLEAGDFFLQRSMSTNEIVKTLMRGFSDEMSLTIPEGFTVQDIDRLVASKGLASNGAMTACAQTCDFSSFSFLPIGGGLATRGGHLEGYLYPDTYFVIRETFDPKELFTRMLTTFQSRVVTGLKDDLNSSPHTLNEIVTMASLVEEEARAQEERETVAGILWKRLSGKISLGVDAAVRYIVNKPRGSLTLADLDSDSPYNLRKYRGLSPGPIASPGLESIKAALHPKDTPYLYYLHDSEGIIHYAQTNDEHNANRQKYLQ